MEGYVIIEHDGKVHWPINIKGKADWYDKPKVFKTFKDAAHWVDKHTYKGMSCVYEIKPIDKLITSV